MSGGAPTAYGNPQTGISTHGFCPQEYRKGWTGFPGVSFTARCAGYLQAGREGRGQIAGGRTAMDTGSTQITAARSE